MAEGNTGCPKDVRTLIGEVSSGSSAAFAELVERYRPLLRGILAGFRTPGMSDEDVEDLEQEELMALYRAADSFNPEQSDVEFGLYAKICVTNSVVSYLRSLQKRAREVTVAGDAELFGEGIFEDPSHAVEREESERLLWDKIERSLSDYENRVWRYYVCGLSAREIAGKLATDERSVGNAVFRIRRKLKKLLRF